MYLLATRFADGWAARKLARRVDDGKEDPDRLNERKGAPDIPRPDGPLVWFHAASVGESLSILELLRIMRDTYPALTLMVTTGTRSSANLLDLRLPEGVIHQFVPVDTKTAVNGFLDHWKPDLALLTESEFWPRLMFEVNRRKIPLALVNGRMSEESATDWRWMPLMIRRLLGMFELLLVQTDEIAARLRKLGAPADRIHVSGSLKEGAVPLPDNEIGRKDFLKQADGRPLWCAASTHEGEESAIATAQRIAARKNPELLLILVPRHPERGPEIAEALDEAGFKVALRSAGQTLERDTEVYVADTLGEMGIWYRVAPVAFVGGSLAEIGGHNPFEPAALGCAILYGPYVSNFPDIYQRLSDGSAAIRVETAEELGAALVKCLHPDQAALLASAAWGVSSDGAGVTDDVVEALNPYLRPLADRAV